MWMGWIGIELLISLHIEDLRREHQDFMQEQIMNQRYIPTFDEYASAKSQAYIIENPVPQAWWKTLVARFINLILKANQ